jgi:hypothetical protein
MKKLLKDKSLIRYNWNKFEQKELTKSYRKLIPKWLEFWDVATDMDPQWCFVSGRYIPPRFRGTSAFQPFKNGEWCFRYEYDKYLSHDVVTPRLSEYSELICIATHPENVRPFTVRPRVKNNESDILKHIRNNPEDILVEHTIGWKVIRQIYFLKPNGKPFPKIL